MKKYTITIKEVIKETQEEQKYPRTETIYEQTIESEPEIIVGIIKATNGFGC